MNKGFLVIFFSLVFFSCNNKVVKSTEKILNTTWVIDTMISENKDIKNCLLINAFSYSKTGLALPVSSCSNPMPLPNSPSSQGTLEVSMDSEKKLTIEIKTENQLFNGIYHATFLYGLDPHGMQILRMHLISQKTFIACTPTLVAYGMDKNAIQYLIDETHNK